MPGKYLQRTPYVGGPMQPDAKAAYDQGGQGINGGNPMLRGVPRMGGTPAPTPGSTPGYASNPMTYSPTTYQTAMDPGNKGAGRFGVPMQAMGPVNAAGVIPTNRIAGGQQVYARPEEMPGGAWTPQQQAAMAQRQQMQAGRHGEGPLAAQYGAATNTLSAQIAEATNAYNARYTDPTERMQNYHLLNQQLQGIRAGGSALMNSFAGQSPQQLNQIAAQQDQRRQDFNLQDGNRYRAEQAAETAAQRAPFAAQTNRPTPLNPAIANATAQQARSMNSADRDAWFRNYMTGLNTEMNRFYGGQGGATPLADMALQGSEWGNNLNEVSNYFRRTYRGR